MGVSTDSILFYGYVWDDECDLLGDDHYDMDWPEIVARKRGFTSPWDAYPEEENAKLPYKQREEAFGKWRAEHLTAIEAWYRVKRDIEAEFGCTISSHCYGEFSIPYVEIAGVGRKAYRGHHVQLTASELAVDQSWDGKLDAFMKELGIPKPHDKPGWFLVSCWG